MADAPAMNCHEVREGFSAPSRGGMGLTEQALVHAHVAQCVDCRKERESLHLVLSSPQRVEPSREPSNFVASLTRLRVLLSISVTGSAQAAVRGIEAARAGAERTISLPIRVRGPLPIVYAPSVRAAANLIEHVRFVITRVAHRLIWLRSSLTIVCQGTARAAIETAGAGVTGVLALLTRLGVLVSISFTVSVEAVGRMIAASGVGVMRILDLLIRAIGTTRDIGRIVVTTSGRAVSNLGARTSALRPSKAAWTRTRLLLRVSTGIVGLAVLVAAIVFLWPPQWPDNLVDRKPALAGTSAPAPVSAPQPAPVEVSRPETPRVTVRPKPSEAQAEIPAPVRRAEPALARSRATDSTPMPPTEAAQNADASDPTAAIDWLLKGGSSRRHIQSP